MPTYKIIYSVLIHEYMVLKYQISTLASFPFLVLNWPHVELKPTAEV